MATQRKLTAGPNKFDLMISLFEGKRVTFTVEGIGTQETQVTRVECEDGSHESWNIQGAFTQRNWQRFTGYFDTRTRKGFIRADFDEQRTERKPKNGDRAYTRYHGSRYEGVLKDLNTTEYPRGLTPGKLIPTDGTNWGYHSDFPGLTVGYEKIIAWDDEAGMWYAPADSD